jgi:hypothetical protein
MANFQFINQPQTRKKRANPVPELGWEERKPTITRWCQLGFSRERIEILLREDGFEVR